MSASNDPMLQACYQRWLGISIADPPPNHYQLLGIKQFESDSVVIQMAAQQRSVAVRQFQYSDQRAEAKIILHEITKAKTCLLNLGAKHAYDQSLKLRDEDELIILEEDDLPTRPAVPHSISVVPSAWAATPLQPTQLSSATLGSDLSLDSLLDLSRDSEELLSAQTTFLPPPITKQQNSLSLEPKVIAIFVGVAFGGLFLLVGLIFLINHSLRPEEVVAENTSAEEVSLNEKASTQMNSGPDVWTRRTKKKQQPENSADSSEASVSSVPRRHRSAPEKKEKPTQDPFARVKHAVNLPIRPASNLDEAKAPAISFGKFDEHLVDKLTLEFATNPGGKSLPITFQIVPRVGTDSSGYWDIHANFQDPEKDSSGLGQAKDPVNSTVAVLSVLDGNLKFQWLNSNIGEYLEHLRFHTLRCKVSNFTHQVALRVIADLPYIPLEFTERRQKTLLKLLPLPPDAKLSFEVSKVDGLEREYHLNPTDGIGALYNSVDVKLDQLSMEIKLEDVPEPSLVVSAEYEIRREKYDFYADQLKEHVDGLATKLKTDENSYRNFRILESNLKKQIFNVQQIFNASNTVQRVFVGQELGKLVSKLKQTRIAMRRIETSRPNLIAELNEAQGYAKWRTELANDAILRVKIRATLGDQTYEIAEYQ